MINFKIDESKCIKCSQCAKDCPMKIIDMNDGAFPYITADNETKCMECQHCLAVCPTAALSICGVNPDDCVPADQSANEDQMEALIRNRRSVRQFKKHNVPKEKLDKLIRTTANAPTGKNARTVTLTLIDNMDDMRIFTDKVIEKLEELDNAGKLVGGLEFFASMARAYRRGNDIIFRGAPHLVLTSVPKDSPCPEADGYISLAYLELMASSMGLGTVWVGYLMYIFSIAPELKGVLNIPEDHVLAYSILLGDPSVKYHRGVIRDEINVNRVSFIKN